MGIVTLEHEGKGTNSELYAKLQLDSGQIFRFHLKKHAISVSPEKVGEQSWYDAISDEDKVRLFSTIAGEYRLRSLGDNSGYKGAAIGVTEDNKIFIGINTMNQEDYFKDCAEQNMLNVATDQVIHQAARNGKDRPTEAPRVRALFMMGGREPDKNNPMDKGLLISCPCGKCTDMLAKVAPKDHDMEVFALPISYGANSNIVIRNGESSMQEVLPGEAWKTTIGHLNADRDIALKFLDKGEDIISIQQKGLAESLKFAASHIGYKESDVYDQMRVKNTELQTPLAIILGAATQNMGNFVDATEHKLKELSQLGKVALQAAENAIMGRKSIPELDLAVQGGGSIHLEPINKFMVEHINEAVAARLRSSGLSPADKGWKEAFEAQISVMRCCVVQLNNGSFHYAIEAQTTQDNAAPNAEVSAITGAMEKLTEARVKTAWVMEMRPKDIESGHMHTSPKEGVERLVKRGTRMGEISFNYIPFNNGTLNERALQKYTQPYKMNAIFPAAFKGSKVIPDNGGQAQTGR